MSHAEVVVEIYKIMTANVENQEMQVRLLMSVACLLGIDHLIAPTNAGIIHPPE